MTKTLEWETLEHAQGPATRIPGTLKKLSGKQEQARVDAFDGLRDSLVGNGRWFSASAPAADTLLTALGKAPEPDLLLVLAADIVGADHVKGWLESPDAHVSSEQRVVIDAALARVSTLTAQLKEKNARARAGATVLMAMLPSLAGEWLPLLMDRIERDEDEVVRASALLAVSRLGEGHKKVSAVTDATLSSTSPLLRGAATLAQLRLDPSREFAASAEGISDWLSAQPAPRERKPWLPWFGGLEVAWYAMHQKLDASAHALFALAQQRGQEAALVDTCLQLGASEPSPRLARRLGALILAGSGLSRHPEAVVRPFDELSESERAVARRLATTTLVPRAGYGLPSAGNSRRRWTGLDAPGPLEQLIDVELDGKQRNVAFWYAVRELNARKVERAEQGLGPFPAPVAAAVAGADRWQAIAELLCMNYATSCVIADRFDQEFAAIELDQRLLRVAAGVADDLVSRVHAANRDELPAVTSAIASAWILLPFVRTKTPINERWDVLVEIGKDVLAHEIFGALPSDRRQARLLGYLEADWKAPHLTSVFDRSLSLLPLVPTVAVVRALLALVERHASQPHHRAPELRAQFESLSAKDERVKAALLEAAHQ